MVGKLKRLFMSKKFWKMYRTYLKSEAWQRKRRKVLIRDRYTCQKCGEKDRKLLQVHHKTYDRVFKESLSDLITLCKKCHKLEHNKRRRRRKKRKKKTTATSSGG